MVVLFISEEKNYNQSKKNCYTPLWVTAYRFEEPPMLTEYCLRLIKQGM